VHEARDRPPLRRHPATDALGLHASDRGAFLEEPDRHLHRLAVRGGHRVRHRLPGERPEERHALRGRDREVEGQHRTEAGAGEQVDAGAWMLPVHERAQLVGLDGPRQPQ
jgi:hypothetical protein